MVTKKNFGIIGGDFRQIYLAKKFYNDGNKVFLYGFNKIIDKSALSNSIEETIKLSDYVILPVPATRDSIHLNASFDKDNIAINDNILDLLAKKITFGDLTGFTKNINNFQNYDYSKNEEFQLMNAVPTAEGAIKTALETKETTIFKSKCLVCGFGRIGKVLANRLEKFGANTTITARNNIDLIWADTLGYNHIPLCDITNTLSCYDLIFNTIPQVIFSDKLLPKCNKNVLIIDLASPPGGIDKNTAEKLHINYIHQLGIPGKMFPETAASIIYYSIKKIIEENFL